MVRQHTFSSGTVTNVSMDSEWIIASLTNCKIYVFSARTGAHVRNLVGHSQGVWALHLVSKGGQPDGGNVGSCSVPGSGPGSGEGELDGEDGNGAAGGAGWNDEEERREFFETTESPNVSYATPQPQSAFAQGGLGFGLGLSFGGLGLGFGNGNGPVAGGSSNNGGGNNTGPNMINPTLLQPPGGAPYAAYTHISPPVSPAPPQHLRSSQSSNSNPNPNLSASTSSTSSSRPTSRGGNGRKSSNNKKKNDLPPLPKGLHARQSDVCNASYGWGQEGALALSGACDRELRVWDVRSG